MPVYKIPGSTKQKKLLVAIENEHGCHIIISHRLNKAGYANLRIHADWTVAHRWVWQVTNKTEIPEGLIIRHTCDVRSCINPAHLEIGTQWDNVQDMISRGRSKLNAPLRGKLSEAEVVEILSLNGVPCSLIAELYGIGKTTVYNIRAKGDSAHRKQSKAA